MNTSKHKEITRMASYIIQIPTGTGVINFTTASNSTSTDDNVISNYGSNFNITKCNYLNNKFIGSSGIFDCDIKCSYSSCSFIGNKGIYLFDSKPKSVVNCYFNNDVTQTISNNAATYEPIQPFDFYISHYSTYYCPATYFSYNLVKNEKDSRKKFKEDELDLDDIKIIVNKVYKTSFVEAVNFSNLAE
ncbi:hypothetical protein TVAG_387430 [Trichomonas vaginalis G3]|uniref:Right handed beta helix domain-containing protein n=1 Tax=Trichomonas vaginalis (strain ATCC PRA-98 / G3) TaxID=412133 RepID=A2FT00_TRIV3|nr:hypothetical protein TVAGG3_0768800 [Trichomonas vaginalis G3]EAX91965.1 hypothetical protein TVAG_387430 [Trichomonas vaginalis G3]KAI5513683.1 hypothetical protein TVAGG3_0768800 [Trichomonas vaginalis G3]|eukprot:XP_001304895.1 hypothetical protein [Trichomonas vaginalis G3]